jgi:hypothetical protein
MKKTVEWKVEQKEDGRYYLTERQSGGSRWEEVRRRGLFGNLDKAQFQSSLSAYEQKLANARVTVAAVEWPL